MGEVTECGICFSSDLVPFLDMGIQPLAERDDGKRYPLKLVRCSGCSLVQLSYAVDQREVFPEDHPYSTGNSAALREHYADLAMEIAWDIDHQPRNGLVVDIGANDGTLLKPVRELALPDMRLLGVEPTGQAAKCEAAGIPVVKGFFTRDLAEQIAREHGKADVITACNVLAHVPDPHDFLSGAAHLLADDGILITENHDWNSVSRGLQIDTVYHEHLRYYTVATLSRLLAVHELTVTDVRKTSMHGGSFRVTAMKEPDGLGVRAKRAAADLSWLVALHERPVYGVGATTRATPLIHYAGLQGFLECVCEVSSSAKIGTKIPGTDIPVVDEQKLIDDQPPAALLLSWHLKDHIIPELRSRGYEGDFIIPLPVPEVIRG